MANYRPIAERIAARTFRKPKNRAIWLAQMKQEAGFTDQTSGAGAQGPAQFMPATARGLGVRNVHDPHEAYTASAHLMKRYLHQYGGDWRKALAAYNAGTGAVAQYHGVPPFSETRNYVKTILGSAGQFRKAASKGGGGRGGGGFRRVGAGSVTVPGRPGTPGIRGTLAGGRFNTVIPTLDKDAFEHASRMALLGSYIASHNPNSPLLRLGVLSTQAPSVQDFMSQRTMSTAVPGQRVRIPGIRGTRGLRVTVGGRRVRVAGGGPRGAGQQGGKAPKGIVRFQGEPVVGSFVPALRYARAHGWKGSVTSGVRTKAQQMAAARSFGLQHYGPAGPLGSNHVIGHPGALDVSDPAGFERALRKFKGRKPIRRMADDPVHFSWTGH